MDLRQVCQLVAETLQLCAGTLLGADAEVVEAQVAHVREDSGTVRLTVEGRNFQGIISEREHSAAQPAVIEYRKASLPKPFRHGSTEIHGLEFALGRQAPQAAIVHVRGECGGGVSFAGCITISEGRDVPTHDLRVFGAPRDLAELAVAIDLLLAGTSPEAGDEIRRICE